MMVLAREWAPRKWIGGLVGPGGGSGVRARAAGGDCAATRAETTLRKGVKLAGVDAVGGDVTASLEPPSEVQGGLVERSVLWLVMVSVLHW